MNVSDNNNINITDYLAGKALYLKIPLSGTFELSPLCNFSCKMCYVRKTQEEVEQNSRDMLTLEDWRRIAMEAKDAGTLYILLTGGEPLLWPDFWTLYDELIDMGFLVTVNTNGALIDEAAIERFRKKPPLKINVTLYGASNETYERLCGTAGVYSKVDRAICRLLENKISVKINCSLTPDNAKDLKQIVEYSKSKGTKLTVATYMFPPIRRNPTQIGENERFTPEESAKYMLEYLRFEREPEEYQRYLLSLKDGCTEPLGLDEGCVDPLDGRIRCRAGRASFWITWDGWITPCGMMPEPKEDLQKMNLETAWKSITGSTDSMTLSGICNKCPNADVCHPCAAIAYAETGKTSGVPTYMCRQVQEMKKIASDNIKDI